MTNGEAFVDEWQKKSTDETRDQQRRNKFS